jgi:hypothetical protein
MVHIRPVTPDRSAGISQDTPASLHLVGIRAHGRASPWNCNWLGYEHEPCIRHALFESKKKMAEKMSEKKRVFNFLVRSLKKTLDNHSRITEVRIAITMVYASNPCTAPENTLADIISPATLYGDACRLRCVCWRSSINSAGNVPCWKQIGR